MKKSINVLVGLALIISIFISYYFLITHKFDEWTIRGQFGDTFGFLNAFFSSMALLGIVYTVIQQNEMIYQSKLEVEMSVKEFNHSIKQFREQQKIQALTILISVYEKKFEEYEKKDDDKLARQANKKVIDLTNELEKFLFNEELLK